MGFRWRRLIVGLLDQALLVLWAEEYYRKLLKLGKKRISFVDMTDNRSPYQ
jgi:hypothetical protein